MGKPIIASIGGDAKQVLLESKGAVICDNSVEGIVKAFEQFKELDDPTIRNLRDTQTASST